MSIFIGNLPYEVSQDDLSQVFADYGTVKSIRMPTDRETGRVRGFAFVEMGSDAEEEKAIEALDGAEWVGRNLKVSKARPREDNGGNRRSSFSGEKSGNYQKQSRRY
jgi:RNA recognition motif-containing protein